MEAKAILRYARISPRKVRIVIDLIRNKSVAEAIGILNNTPKAASEYLIKLLNSAIANATNKLGLDLLTIIALGVEVLLVLFFLIKSALSYESALNRALDKVNYWLFEKKVVTEENVRELNDLFKKKGPKRLCYYWQQYILFREHDP